jgi:hypothetical protein
MPSEKTSPDPIQDSYLEALRRLVAQTEASQRLMQESSQALLEANRSSLEQFAERLIEASNRSARELSEILSAKTREYHEVVIQPLPVSGQDATSKELLLTYDVFRTMLGRAPTAFAPGAASVFIAERVDGKGKRDDDGDSIKILSPAPFAGTEDNWTLVVLTTDSKTLSASLHTNELPVIVQVPHLASDIDILRLEILDQNGDPIFLGLGPAVQTRNAQRHKYQRELQREAALRELDRRAR